MPNVGHGDEHHDILGLISDVDRSILVEKHKNEVLLFGWAVDHGWHTADYNVLLHENCGRCFAA